MEFTSLNPTTEEIIATYPEMTRDEMFKRVAMGHQAFLRWRQFSFSCREKALRQLASKLSERRKVLAKLMASEMGKPLGEGLGEIDKCALACEFFAKHAQSFLASRTIETNAKKSFITHEPLGLILGIMPWNFPFWQVIRFAAPTLMAGNGILLKHAPNVSGCALALEEMYSEINIPKGLFQTFLMDHEKTSECIAHPLVQGVSLTGSPRAGREVASVAGRSLKKVVLELGGSDPYIILEDANLKEAAQLCVQARIANAGQICISAKRLIVVRKVYESFKAEVFEQMRSMKMGNPLEPDTRMGPLARSDLREHLHLQVESSVAKGAKLLLGGQIPSGKGFFYPPTLLTEIPKGTPAYGEELFGPVVALFPVKNEEEAILLANDSDYGLGAAVFTEDRKRGLEIAEKKLEAGNCFVNAQVRSDPLFPFGGIKQSGFGRELGEEGIKEFVNVKTVVVC